MAEEIIGEIRKDSCSALRVTLFETYDKHFIDIRQFIKTPNGKWIPTDKGLRLGSRLDEVMGLIEKAKKRRQEIEQQKMKLPGLNETADSQ